MLRTLSNGTAQHLIPNVPPRDKQHPNIMLPNQQKQFQQCLRPNTMLPNQQKPFQQCLSELSSSNASNTKQRNCHGRRFGFEYKGNLEDLEYSDDIYRVVAGFANLRLMSSEPKPCILRTITSPISLSTAGLLGSNVSRMARPLVLYGIEPSRSQYNWKFDAANGLAISSESSKAICTLRSWLESLLRLPCGATSGGD
ncbi:hypothetical protein FF38_08841 [Lucilia cuprina]|uniref:Uncharacterized protein n=1 Tax=Lucilia cuprina TaxID=7375 RepID=A0A0L0CFH4_LUCCU|nr:hypothetical protein FF38_08841 [Lucilia cuprina]